MTDRTRLAVLQVGLLLAVCLFLFFFGIGAFGLVGADEPRYAQISREMLDRHNWIVPTLNGTPWLEKPVLLYWKVMGSFRIFGVQDWAARLPAAFHAAGLVLVIFFFMRRFRPGSELDAALMAASTAATIAFARAASTDMLLSAPFCVGLLAWWAWRQTGNKLWLAVFYALLAGGALAKGPVAPVLAVLIVGAYALVRRDSKILLSSLWLPGFALFFLIALPWFVAIQMKVPQFFHVFFLEHNLARFSTNVYRHSQPFWYYVPVFFLATIPWTVFTLPALIHASRVFWKQVRSGQDQSAPTLAAQSSTPITGESQKGQIPDDLPVFLFLWIVIPIVFFSISKSKLPGYILPAIPPAALLTADYLHRRRVIPRLQLALHSLLCGGLMAAAMLTPWFMLGEAAPGQTRAIVAVTSGLIAVLVLVVVRRGGLPTLHFATLVPMVLGIVFLLRFAAIPAKADYPIHGLILDITQSARPVDLALRRLGVKDGTPVAVFNVRRDVAYGLNFYRNQPVTYYEQDGPRDLPSGIPAQEHVLIAKAGNEAAVQAVVAPRQLTRLGDFPPQHLEFFLVPKVTLSKVTDAGSYSFDSQVRYRLCQFQGRRLDSNLVAVYLRKRGPASHRREVRMGLHTPIETHRPPQPFGVEILDLRHFTSQHLRPLLENENRLWAQMMSWDYRSSAEMILRYVDSKILPGYAAVENGRIGGYAFFVYEGNKGVIGDLYADGSIRLPAEPGRMPESVEERLAAHVIDTLQRSPGVQRIEAQLLPHESGALADPFLQEGFRQFPRLFMVLNLDGPAVEVAEFPDIDFRRWLEHDFQSVSSVITACYRGHIDSEINDQYRSLNGSLRFLNNIVRFPGCGIFDAHSSFVAVHRPSRSIVGLLLCSRVRDDVGHVTQVCVIPGHRGRGIAESLIGLCTRELRSRNFTTLSLTVTEANFRAVGLYHRLGFVTRRRFDAFVWES